MENGNSNNAAGQLLYGRPYLQDQLVTIADLQKFRSELIKDLKKLLQIQPTTIQKPWLKSYEVQKLLKISPGTLQHLRDKGVIKFSRVGGIIYYHINDVQVMMQT